jgi:hypothetical protein
MKVLKRIAILTFCTGLLLSATSCAVYVPTDNAAYNGHHHRFFGRHHANVEVYGESHERRER